MLPCKVGNTDMKNLTGFFKRIQCVTFDQRRAWVESHTPPYGVFVVESEDGSIIGFGALSVFYDRAGYDLSLIHI